MITLTLLGAVETLAVALITFDAGPRPHLLVVGALGLGAMYAAAGILAVARYESINTFLMPSVVGVLALTMRLVPHVGLTGRGLFLLHPAEPAMTLMRAAYLPISTLELTYGAIGTLVWTLIAFHLARRRFAALPHG